MNLDLFDDMDGIILRERETSVNSMNIRPDTNGTAIPHGFREILRLQWRTFHFSSGEMSTMMTRH